jgi:hypothetical protein
VRDGSAIIVCPERHEMTRLIVVVLTEIDDALMAALEGSNEIVSLCELRRVRRDTMSLAECETAFSARADVVLCHPGLMMALLRELPRDVLCNVQWIQSTWAGVEALSQFFAERPPLPHVPVVVRFAGARVALWTSNGRVVLCASRRLRATLCQPVSGAACRRRRAGSRL